MLNTKSISIFLISILILSSVSIVTAEDTTPNIIHVSMSGNDTNNGLTPETSKRTIQSAVDTAINESIIQIAPGTYKENTIFIKNKKLTLRGVDPKTTIIQVKDKKYHSVIVVEYNSDVLVQKLTLTRVKSKKESRGLYNEGFLTVEGSIITGHVKYEGGAGITNQYNGILSVKDCIITNNTANYSGGGIGNFQGIVLVEDSVISNNTLRGDMGGGISNGLGFCTIRRSVISGNEVYPSFGMGYFRGLGGGLFNVGKMIIQDSLITGNTANYGGGYYGMMHSGWKNDLILENSIISSNKARISGGGVYITKKGHLTMRNSTIIDNKPNNGYKGT